MSEQATFGSWLKDRRKALDLTQDELAQHVGCSLMLIQKMEAGERRPSKQIAELLATQLNVPADEHADFVRFARSKDVRFSADEKSPWRARRQHQTNLPVPPTPLFGREQEIAAVVERMTHDHVRLMTLVGPPGIGKTRLALACADELLDQFDDGVYWVGLAPVQEPDLVAPTIARALGATETAGQSFVTLLTQQLAGKRLLLLLDNFEQVIAAAPLVAELLTNCPWLQVLVTSRVSLHVRAERQWRVAPLTLPPPTESDDPERLLDASAVQFFVDRARSVEPSFRISSQNAAAVAQICARLDGLPLAIELIATQAYAFSPQELLAQLDRRPALSTQGPRDLPARHQTLRDAIAWSYDLLNADEQQLFARLAAFVGGCTAPAVQQVCGDAEPLARLVDKSLLIREDERYVMLEVLREYALERLTESGAAVQVRLRHAAFFLDVAECAERELTGPHQVVWLDRLEKEHHNLRTALRWAVDTADVETALRLSGALWRFWQARGYLGEGLAWLQAALKIKSTPSDAVLAAARAQALLGLGWLLRDGGDFVGMKSSFEECLRLCEKLDDKPRLAYALYCAGFADYLMGDCERGIRTIEQSVALYRTLPEASGVALPLFMLGRIAVGQGDYDRAQRFFMESLEIERKRGATFGTGKTLGNLGELAIYRGDYAHAGPYLEESEKILRALGERQLLAWVLTKRGELGWHQSDLAQAQTFLDASLELSREIGYRWNTAYSLTYLGLVALGEGDAARAQARCGESLALFRELASEQDIAQTQKDLARVMLHQGDYARAEELYLESLGVLARRHCAPDIAECFEGIATLRSARGDLLTAARLLGAAEALRERIGAPLPPVLQAHYLQTVSALRARLSEPIFGEKWAEGRGLTLEQAIECAGRPRA